MNRRNFLRTTGALSLPALLSSGVAADPAGFFSQFINPDSDKILVLIRLAGGNDGLNTLIGLDQLSNLQQVRSNVALSENQVLLLNDTVGLHGRMTGLKSLFDNGQLGAIQAVGYPNQNRSHFRSTDIWTSGAGSDEIQPKGWLGRYLELEHPEFPTGYPNDPFNYPLAMTMGNVVSSTCQGTSANLSVVVNNPFNYLYIAPGGNTALPNNFYGDEVSYVRGLISQSNQYGAIVQESANAGTSMATTYTEGSLSDQLKNIATLISGGLKTKIYVATLGGFDTHSDQIQTDDRLTGVHGDLMEELSASIKAFIDDLELIGCADRVMGMTFSEFGRRIRSNQSNGTDHGDAGPLFLFGNCVQGGVLGNSPIIDTEVAQNVGVPFQYDFRDVYGSVLVDWFQMRMSTVQSLFNGGFTYLPIASGCSSVLATSVHSISAIGLDDFIEVQWHTQFDAPPRGFTVERSENGRNFRSIRRMAANVGGGEQYAIEDHDVRKGPQYYYRVKVEAADGTITTSNVQIASLRGTAQGEWAVGLPRPNPVSADSYIKVYAPVDAVANFELIDAQGRRLRTGTVNLQGRMDNRIPLQPASLPPGHYVWRLTTPDGERFARKVVK